MEQICSCSLRCGQPNGERSRFVGPRRQGEGERIYTLSGFKRSTVWVPNYPKAWANRSAASGLRLTRRRLGHQVPEAWGQSVSGPGGLRLTQRRMAAWVTNYPRVGAIRRVRRRRRGVPGSWGLRREIINF